MNRRQMKILEILKLNTYSIEDISQLFNVSEKTIVNDIDYLINNLGMKIQVDKKMVFIPIDCLESHTNCSDDMYSYMLQIYYLLGLSARQISEILNYSTQKIYADLKHLFVNLEVQSPYRLVNPLLILEQDNLEEISSYIDHLESSDNYVPVLIKAIYSNEENKISSMITLEELISPYNDIITHNFEAYELDAYKLTSVLIQNIESVTFVNLNQMEKYYLFQHVRRIYVNLKYNIEHRNPNLSFVYRKYKKQLSAISMVVRSVLRNMGLYIIENEVLFISIHFLKEDRDKNIILVCETGYTTAFLLKKQLEQYFTGFHVKYLLAKEEVNEIATEQDLIISTVPLDSENVIIVSANLDQNDIKVLKKYLKINSRPMDEPQRIYEQYKPLFRSEVSYKMFLKYYEGSKNEPMLKDLLTKEFVQIINEKIDWKEAICIASNPLIVHNKIEKNYTNAMISALEKNGPYVCFTDNFAMPHARPEDGVNETCMSMLITSEPVDLLGQDVQMFVILGSVDNASHLIALTQLTDYISDPEFISEILKCSTKEEIIERINI